MATISVVPPLRIELRSLHPMPPTPIEACWSLELGELARDRRGTKVARPAMAAVCFRNERRVRLLSVFA